MPDLTGVILGITKDHNTSCAQIISWASFHEVMEADYWSNSCRLSHIQYLAMDCHNFHVLPLVVRTTYVIVQTTYYFILM